MLVHVPMMMAAAGRQQEFQFAVNATQVIGGEFSTLTGKSITVYWGDGTDDTYSGTNQSWSKDYGSVGNRTVTIVGSQNLTEFTMDQSGADISFDLANLPSGLTVFYCTGSNTVSGDLANLPSGLTYFICTGYNTVSGDLANLPSGLTYFYCTGSNTISGDLANLPSGLTYFRCYGSNTVSGDLANLPSGLTYFICGGYNTVSGDLANLPSGLTYFICTGYNTIDAYTSKTWTTKPATFYFVPVSPGGLSQAEVDQLLADLDDDFSWTTGEISLTGTNAAPSAVGLAAKSNMEAEGATVTVNS